MPVTYKAHKMHGIAQQDWGMVKFKIEILGKIAGLEHFIGFIWPSP